MVLLHGHDMLTEVEDVPSVLETVGGALDKYMITWNSVFRQSRKAKLSRTCTESPPKAQNNVDARFKT